ncbi:L,D-transpeptidase family protein [Microbulbifer sp. MCCC 1A16149]|uniref:L,D-transpeptidase family protein n=1 Tax=Microbulbifer sp. MCCC 1A16149 TaxID=3411322 RepID=UPI003D131CE3
MSSITSKQLKQSKQCRHFYAIVALSCCALLPLMETATAEDTEVHGEEPKVQTEHPAPEQASRTPQPQQSESDKPDSKKAESEQKEPEQAPEKKKPVKREKQAAAEPQAKPDNKEGKNTKGDKAAESAQTATAEPQKKAAEKNSEPDQQPYTGADSAVHFATAGNRLREEAARYREMNSQWQAIEPGVSLRAGDQGPRVAQLRKLLHLFGDYTGQPGPVSDDSGNPERFDAGLQLAVESYQHRHGMVVTGVADKATLRELERPPKELARLLELNAKRWDQLPDNPGQRYILVNVPDFRLQLIDRQRIVLSMKTVVGKSTKRTPEMTTKVVSVVFNPTWTVPRSILLTDLLPKARNNPEAMHKRGYRVVKYGTNTTTPISDESIQSAASGKATLRQISGPGNTLGRVKFVIPNKQAIFLHDTQAQSLFENHHRAYSHGCIRLQQPEELAYALLGHQGWDRTRVAQATTGDESVTIKVDDPPKLFITYLTAWVDGLGKVNFRPDIYHRDN